MYAGDPTVDRRRLLQSLGVAGGAVGPLSGLARSHAASTPAQASDVDWGAVELEFAEFAGNMAGYAASRLFSAVDTWLNEAFGYLQGLYDAVTEVLADSFQDLQALGDVEFLLNGGSSLLSEIENAPDMVEEEEDEEDDDAADDGDDGSDGDAAAAPVGGARTSAAHSGATAAGSAAASSAMGWPDVPGPNDFLSAFEDLSEEALDIARDAWDDFHAAANDAFQAAYDSLEDFIERIGRGFGIIIGEIAEHICNVIAAPFRQLSTVLSDAVSSATPGADFSFDVPGLNLDLPLGVSSPHVSLGDDGDSSSATSSSAAASSARATSGASAAGSLQVTDDSPPSEPFNRYVERAHGEVTGQIGDRTDLTFPERHCRGARGPIHTVGFEMSYPDLVLEDLDAVSVDSALTVWAGHEPGRPCLYTGVDPDLTVSVSMQEVYDMVEQNQAEAHAVASYVRDRVDYYETQVQALLPPEGEDLTPAPEPTFRDVAAMADGMYETFSDLEDEMTSDADLSLDVEPVLEDMDVATAASRADDLRTRVDDAADAVVSSDLLADLAATLEALDASDPEPPAIDDLQPMLEELPSSTDDAVPAVAFELPDLLDQVAPDLAAWIDDLGAAGRSRIEGEAGVDLDRVRDQLTDVDHPLFTVSEDVRQFAERVVQAQLDRVRSRLEEYLTVSHEITEGWDEWLCAGLCFDPRLATPVPVAVYWIFEEVWKIATDVAEAIVPEIRLPDPYGPVAEELLIAIVAVVVIGAIIFGVGTSPGWGSAAVIIGGLALVPIIVYLAMSGSGDGSRRHGMAELFLAPLTGDQIGFDV